MLCSVLGVKLSCAKYQDYVVLQLVRQAILFFSNYREI